MRGSSFSRHPTLYTALEAARTQRRSAYPGRVEVLQVSRPAAHTRRLIWWACRGKYVRFRVPDVGLNGRHRLTHLRELNGNHLVVSFPNGGRRVVWVKLTAQGELVPAHLPGDGGVSEGGGIGGGLGADCRRVARRVQLAPAGCRHGQRVESEEAGGGR